MKNHIFCRPDGKITRNSTHPAPIDDEMVLMDVAPVSAVTHFITFDENGEPSGVDEYAEPLTLPPDPPLAGAELVEAIRQETERRIFAYASRNTQMNMAGACAAGLMSPTEVLAFQSGLGWVASMRAAGAQLAGAGDLTFEDDAHWPAVPADAVALAAQY